MERGTSSRCVCTIAFSSILLFYVLSIYCYQSRFHRFLPFMDSISSSSREAEKAPGSPQAAGKSGDPLKALREGHSERGGLKKNSRIERAWREMEEQLARIPIDGDGLGIRSDDDQYTAEILLRSEDPGIDYGLWKFMDRDEIPRWTQRHRWRAEWEQREKLKELFQRWDKQSFENGLTYCCFELPKRFRFALKRPLMPAEDLGDILEELDLNLTFPEAYSFHTKRSKRARHLLLGINPHETSHVSGYYRDMIQSPNALTEALDTYHPSVKDPSVRQAKANQQTSKPRTEALDIHNPSVRQPRQAKIDGQTEQQIKAACSVWGSFRAGEIDYTSVLNQFRTILNDPGISDLDLAWRLEEFDIPMAGFLGQDDQLQRPGIAEPDEDEREIIQELSQCVKSYHTGACTLDETLMFVCDRLDGMVLDLKMFSDLLDEEGYTEYEIATHIWECATEEPDQKSSEAAKDVGTLLVAGLSIEDLTADFVGKYMSKIVDGLDPGLALTEYREELGIEDFSPSQISYMLSRLPPDQVKPSEKDDMTDDRIDDLPYTRMGPPGRKTTEREPSLNRKHTQSTAGEKTSWRGAFSSTAGNPMDCDYENLSSSPEEGVSDSLFGLALPTKEAQRIGQRIGLPADFVRSRIRSSTLKRVNVRKRRKLSISVTSPTKKRRSETDLDQQNWFAKDGEDQKTFVRNNFSKGSLLSRAVTKVLSEPCIEEAQSPSHRISSSPSPERLVLHSPKPIKLKLSPSFENPSSGQSSPSDSPSPSLPWSTEPSPHLDTPLSTCVPSPYLDPKEPPPSARDVSLSPMNGAPAKTLIPPSGLTSSELRGHVERQTRSSINGRRPGSSVCTAFERVHSTELDRSETLNQPAKLRSNVPPEGIFRGTTQDLQDWAFRKRKSFFVMLEILRKSRKEKTRTPSANSMDDSYFQNSSSNSGSSTSTSALNKLFDKYRGMESPPQANESPTQSHF